MGKIFMASQFLMKYENVFLFSLGVQLRSTKLLDCSLEWALQQNRILSPC